MSPKQNPGILIASYNSLSSGKVCFYLKLANCCTFSTLIPHTFADLSPVLDSGDRKKNKTLSVLPGESSQAGRQINR